MSIESTVNLGATIKVGTARSRAVKWYLLQRTGLPYSTQIARNYNLKHFYLTHWPSQVLPLRVSLDLRTKTMKRYSAFPKAPSLVKPHHQIFNYPIQDTRWVIFTPLQRCSKCILQPQLTVVELLFAQVDVHHTSHNVGNISVVPCIYFTFSFSLSLFTDLNFVYRLYCI